MREVEEFQAKLVAERGETICEQLAPQTEIETTPLAEAPIAMKRGRGRPKTQPALCIDCGLKKPRAHDRCAPCLYRWQKNKQGVIIPRQQDRQRTPPVETIVTTENIPVDGVKEILRRLDELEKDFRGCLGRIEIRLRRP